MPQPVKKKLDSELVKELGDSESKVGALTPVIVSSKTGEVVDGLHRLMARPKWPVTKLPLDKKQTAIARLVLNSVRHPMEALDFNTLAAILLKEGVERGFIAREIHKLTGISYASITAHLANDFKMHHVRHLSEADRKEMSEKAKAARAKRSKIAATLTEEEEVPNAEKKAAEAAQEYSVETSKAYESKEPVKVSEGVACLVCNGTGKCQACQGSGKGAD